MKSLTVLALAAALLSCDRPPTAPTPPPTTVTTLLPPTAPTPPTTVGMSGAVVDEAGLAIADARVTVYAGFCFTMCCNCGSTKASVQSAADGRFAVNLDLPGAINPPGAFDVSIEKPGYERTTQYVHRTGVMTVRTLRMRSLPSIAAGETASLEIDAEDSFCGFDYQFKCRHVRMSTATAGTVTLDVKSTSGGGGIILGDPFAALGTVALPVTVLVAAESTTDVYLAVGWGNVPQRLALTTTAPKAP